MATKRGNCSYHCYCSCQRYYDGKLQTYLQFDVVENNLNPNDFKLAAKQAIGNHPNLDYGFYDVVVCRNGEERVFRVEKHSPVISVKNV